MIRQGWGTSPACLGNCNCPVALSEFTTLLLHDSTLFKLDSFKKCNCSRKNLLQKQFASQMWATRPHLGSIFVKLLHRKTFQFVLRTMKIQPQVICSRKPFSFAHLHIFPKSLTFSRLSFIIKNNPAHIVQKIIEMRKL